MKITFVVQRYGEDVAGGAEALARSTAQVLAARGHSLRVLTSTARDYLSWADVYPEGETREEGVTLERFRALPPDPERAAALTRALSLAPGDADQERDWVKAQGPICPGLLDALAHDRSGVVVFWTYLYATTQLGLPLVRGRSVLVPLAHDEPPFRFTPSRGVVRIADGLAFMTPEEERLVDELHAPRPRAREIVAAGVEPQGGDAERGQALAGSDGYVLYLGRVDPAKGVLRLIRAHQTYRSSGGRLDLVIGGRATQGVRVPAGTRTLGFVSGADRANLTAGAQVVALPSRHESLSLVALEAWAAGVPTLANGESDVLAGQTARSGGGLLWFSDADYTHALTRLQTDTELRADLHAAGRAWAATRSWDACASRWEALLGAIATGTS